MASKLSDLTTAILTDLEDLDGEVWGRREIEEYIVEGYNQLARETNFLWDMWVVEARPMPANHTAPFEAAFLDQVLGRFNFTSEWERDWVDGGAGPSNHTAIFESTLDGAVVEANGAYPLPAETLVVDRVTFDNYRIHPFLSSELRARDRRHRTTEGSPLGYTIEQDGMMVLRVTPIPSAGAVYSTSGSYGTLRNASAAELPTSDNIGELGVARSIPGHFPIGQYGSPRRVLQDSKNTRVEFCRRPRSPRRGLFEIPDRYLSYIECFAKARAYKREGPGQNTQMSTHMMARFSAGVERIKARLGAMAKARVTRMGGGADAPRWMPSGRMPWPYEQIPSR